MSDASSTPSTESTSTPASTSTESTSTSSTTTESAAPSTSTAASADGATTEPTEAVTGADSTAEYEPVVQLKPVETSSGEEQEELVYKQRAALYRFDVSEWKERGRGDVKLLKHKDTGKIRLLLRQEKTLKCCMNHLVNSAVELVANAGSDRSWTWHILDYANDAPEGQTFAIRFRDAETAQQFKDEYDKARAHNKALESKSAGGDEKKSTSESS